MSNRCKGITKKGVQCLIKVNGDYCRYHVRQATAPPEKPKPGFIYIYTIASLLSKQSQDGWLRTRNLDPKHKGKWVAYSSKLEFLLVKVGMTTKSVDVRIRQWEDQCNHKLQALYPGGPALKRSLLDRLGLLSVKDEHYPSFQQDQHGFWAATDVRAAEREIHKELGLLYGRGDMRCTGCVKKAEEESRRFDIFRKKEFLEGQYNVHVEWFPVPKKGMNSVYSVVDRVCQRH